MIKEIVLVSPRGFCAGVTRSINVVKDVLDLFGAPVYIKHAIVHNNTVIRDLEKRGAIIVDEVKDIPRGAVAVFSAHGSPPEHFEQAKKRGIKVIDATCPLVTKVHFEMISALKKGWQPVYIGHKGHVEAVGVLGEALVYGVNVPVVSSVDDVGKLKLDLDDGQVIMVLVQTTFNVEKVKKVIKALRDKFENVVEPPEKDICYATTNRQSAIKKLAQEVDLVLVVGSKESSNSNRLVEVAKGEGVPAYLIENLDDIDEKWLKGIDAVGLSAGASAPETVVREIVDYFTDKGIAKRNLIDKEEQMFFSEPLELKKMKKAREDALMEKIEINFNKGKLEGMTEKFLVDFIVNLLRLLIKDGKIKIYKKIVLSVAVVEKEDIKKMNKKYRKSDSVTDVLSFCYENQDDLLEGEIILCDSVIRKNAREDGVSFESEFLKNIVHSVLHIIGYEHGEEMFALQELLLKKLDAN